MKKGFNEWLLAYLKEWLLAHWLLAFGVLVVLVLILLGYYVIGIILLLTSLILPHLRDYVLFKENITKIRKYGQEVINGLLSFGVPLEYCIERKTEKEIEGRIKKGDKGFCLIIGEAGNGKTTLLCKLAQIYLKDEKYCTFFYKAQDFEGGDFMSKIKKDMNVENIDLDTISKKGYKILLFLDTLDVIPYNNIGRLSTLITRFNTENGLIIATCRPLEAASMENKNTIPIEKFTLEELSEEEIQKLIEKYNEYYKKHGVETVIQRDKISDIFKNPLHIKMLFEIYDELQTIPNNINMLYKKYWKVKVEYTRTTILENSSFHEFVNKKKRLVKAIAEEMIKDKENKITINYRTIENYISQNKMLEVYEDIKSDNIIKYDGKKLGFFHQTFFEYAAAMCINEMIEDAQDRNKMHTLIQYTLNYFERSPYIEWLEDKNIQIIEKFIKSTSDKDLDKNTKMKFYKTYGNTLKSLGSDLGKAIEKYKDASNYADQEEDKINISWNLAETYRLLDQYSKAIDILRDVREKSERKKDPNNILKSSVEIAKCQYVIGHLGEALESCKSVDKYLSQVDNDKGVYFYYNLSKIYYLLGNYDEANRIYNLGIEIASSLDAQDKEKSYESNALLWLKGEILRMQEYYDDSKEKYKAAEQTFSRTKSRAKTWILDSEAEIERAKGNYEESIKNYERCREESELMGNKNRVAHSLLGIAENNRMKGIKNGDNSLLEEALNKYKEAEDIYNEIGSEWGKVHVKIGNAFVFLYQRKFKEAKKLLEDAKLIATQYKITSEIELIRKILENINNENNNLIELHPLSFP
ncbi:MAG: hypothetical protein CVT88_06340 [Candidatus Altiarchaeales archaeon HGW-Altiarchaeales-1]|nr:MAG: hypothetical protein CVT88_06340 [Candidatus Altiarchaeales archaeon HGW-Altiarchaeales-1]